MVSYTDKLRELDEIISRLRYVKTGDLVLSIDHNSFVDAVKKIREILGAISPPPTLEVEVSSYEEVYAVDFGVWGDPIYVVVDNNGIAYARSNDVVALVQPDGTFTLIGLNYCTSYNFGAFIGISSTGKYVVVNGLPDKILVFKNGVLLSQLSRSPLRTDEDFANSTVAISPNGKYVALLGYHGTTNKLALKLWRGK